MNRMIFAVCLAAFGLVASFPGRRRGWLRQDTVPQGRQTKPAAHPDRQVRREHQRGDHGRHQEPDRGAPGVLGERASTSCRRATPTWRPSGWGRSGPFMLHGAGKKERREKMTVAPGATERLSLDVYCIDSHRASPSSATSFRIAKDRVPESLTRAISDSAEQAAKPYGGVSAAPAKSVVQSEVWKNRDKKWIELDGEGRQEIGKRR